jgi:hypothetical protein
MRPTDAWMVGLESILRMESSLSHRTLGLTPGIRGGLFMIGRKARFPIFQQKSFFPPNSVPDSRLPG